MRRLNKVTALVIAGVISCTSPMMVMASDSGSVMSQAEEILKDNEVGSLASCLLYTSQQGFSGGKGACLYA